MTTTKLKVKELEYPYNLIYAIFENNPDTADEVYNKAISTYDFKGTIEYVLYTLSDNERVVIKYIFKELKTLREIAELLNVCHERVRQLKVKALRKLRHPNNAKYIRCGLNAYIENLKANCDATNKKLAEANIKLSVLKGEPIEIPPIYIRDMGFSVRTYNCLNRAGIETLNDCLELTYDDFAKIRNLGRHCMEEIAEKLHSYGYEIK